MRPSARPHNPNFSSGPCAKRPGWHPGVLAGAFLGRSHRSAEGRARLREVIERSRSVLGIPADYRVGIVPASDTGAVEIALWSLLGARGVDMLAWESFGRHWVVDVMHQLRLEDVRLHEAPYGALPDLAAVDPGRDVVFAWNGTTSGVRVPDGAWLAPGRAGLAITDATSAAFAMDLPWPRLDAVTWSWQKALGGEAQHGMLALSPRAVARLESHVPPWPLPKLFRLTKGGRLNEAIFHGETINTPSMLCVEDALDGLCWAEAEGGLPGLIARAEANLATITAWVEATPWVEFLAADARTRSTTSVCLSVVDAGFSALGEAEQRTVCRRLAGLLADEGVAYDINGHRDAPPGLRIWTGATIERADIEALLPWLDWAWRTVGVGETVPA